jgi:hypothetical protein
MAISPERIMSEATGAETGTTNPDPRPTGQGEQTFSISQLQRAFRANPHGVMNLIQGSPEQEDSNDTALTERSRNIALNGSELFQHFARQAKEFHQTRDPRTPEMSVETKFAVEASDMAYQILRKRVLDDPSPEAQDAFKEIRRLYFKRYKDGGEEQIYEDARIRRAAFNVLRKIDPKKDPELQSIIEEGNRGLLETKVKQYLERNLAEVKDDKSLKALYFAGDRSDLRALDDTQLEKFGLERISTETQQGFTHDYIWPAEAKEKVRLMRNIINNFENSFLAQSPTHQDMLNELYQVIPHFQRSIKWENLGDVMFEEMKRRLDFLQAYQKYKYSTDTDGVISGVGETYNLIWTILLKNTRSEYETKGNAKRSNLYVAASMRWWKDNMTRALRTPEDSAEWNALKEECKQDLRNTFPDEIDDESEESSTNLGWRGLETWLVRAKEDYLTATSGPFKGERYQLYALKTVRNKNGEEEQVPDVEKRDSERKRFHEDAEQGRIGFLATSAKQGAQASRNIGKGWAITQVKNWNLNVELLDDVDFQFRDLGSLLPQDINDYYANRSPLVEYFSSFQVNNDQVSSNYWVVKKRADLMYAITGRKMELKGSKRRDASGKEIQSWSASYPDKEADDVDGMRTLDISKVAYQWQDLNDLVMAGVIDAEEFNNRVDILKDYMNITPDTQVSTNKKGEVVTLMHTTGKKTGEGVPEVISNAWEKVFEESGKLVDFSQFEEPSQRISRYIKNPDSLKGEFVKEGGFGSSPKPETLIDFAHKFYFMRGGRHEREVQLMINYSKREIRLNRLPNDAKAMDNLIANIATSLSMPVEDTKHVFDYLKKNHKAYLPLLVFMSYVPVHNILWEFFSHLFKGFAKQALKG